MPNWAVREASSNPQAPEPNKLDPDAPYWFFRWFSSDTVVDVLDVGEPPMAGLQERYLHFYATQALRARVRLLCGDYDCVVCHGTQSAVGLLAMARLMRFSLPPTVVIDVGALNQGQPGRTISFNLTRWALGSASAIVWHATSSLEMCATHAPELLRVGRFIPFGINLRDVAGAHVVDGDYAICVGSRFRDWGTLWNMAEKASHVAIVVVGVECAGRVPRNVRVLPRVPFREYIDLVARSRIVLLPLPDGHASYGQTTLLQAMAMGKPTVVTDVGPLRDYIGPWCEVVPPARPDLLLERVMRLWGSEPARRAVGDAARRATRALFEESLMAERLERLVMAVSTPVDGLGLREGADTTGPLTVASHRDS